MQHLQIKEATQNATFTDKTNNRYNESIQNNHFLSMYRVSQKMYPHMIIIWN